MVMFLVAVVELVLLVAMLLEVHQVMVVLDQPHLLQAHL
jgi:hypothetical protein